MEKILLSLEDLMIQAYYRIKGTKNLCVFVNSKFIVGDNNGTFRIIDKGCGAIICSLMVDEEGNLKIKENTPLNASLSLDLAIFLDTNLKECLKELSLNSLVLG